MVEPISKEDRTFLRSYYSFNSVRPIPNHLVGAQGVYESYEAALSQAEERIEALENGLRLADEWLAGWASAEPYRTEIQKLLDGAPK